MKKLNITKKHFSETGRIQRKRNLAESKMKNEGRNPYNNMMVSEIEVMKGLEREVYDVFSNLDPGHKYGTDFHGWVYHGCDDMKVMLMTDALQDAISNVSSEFDLLPPSETLFHNILEAMAMMFITGEEDEALKYIGQWIEECGLEPYNESWIGDKAKAGWKKVKDGAKKLGKAIGDAFNGPFRKGDHVEMTGQNGESIKGTVTGWDMGDRTYTVLLGNNYDESLDDDDVVEGIPNWAISYIMYDDPSGIQDSDQKMVDEFVADLAKDNLVLVSPIDGTENEFNSYPAFGDACDTTDWSCRKI